MLAKLQQDQFRLKQVQSTEGKAKLKAELLPEYVPYIEGVLSAGQGAQDDVLVAALERVGVAAGQGVLGVDVGGLRTGEHVPILPGRARPGAVLRGSTKPGCRSRLDRARCAVST